MDEIQEIVLRLTCPRCGRGDGDWCVTKSGKRASYLHDVRSGPVYKIYRDGWLNGRKSGENYFRNRTQQVHVDTLAGVVDRLFYGTPFFGHGNGHKVAAAVIAEGWRPTS